MPEEKKPDEKPVSPFHTGSVNRKTGWHWGGTEPKKVEPKKKEKKEETK